jgi:hypothetical protein
MKRNQTLGNPVEEEFAQRVRELEAAATPGMQSVR